MKCKNCNYVNPDFVNECINCGNRLTPQNNANVEDTTGTPEQKTIDTNRQYNMPVQNHYNTSNNQNRTKKNKFSKKDQKFIMNLLIVFILLAPLLFFVRASDRGINLGELMTEVTPGLVVLSTLAISVWIALLIWLIGVRIGMTRFEDSKTYPLNDYFIKIYKIYNLGMLRNLPDKIGFLEVANFGSLNIFAVVILSTLTVIASLTGNQLMFIIGLVLGIIALIIFIAVLLFPNVLNNYFTEDIRSEKGFRKFFYIAQTPLLLSLIGIVLYLLF